MMRTATPKMREIVTIRLPKFIRAQMISVATALIRIAAEAIFSARVLWMPTMTAIVIQKLPEIVTTAMLQSIRAHKTSATTA